ncbi:hypothetical protein [Bacillus sp. UMB0893]|uniref:hypothetical protein n=1 Tax=Bacillus sp. UMB0893 TaxID=2066053 RepID=UPI00269E44FD
MNAGNPIQMSLMMNKVPDEMKGIANPLWLVLFTFYWCLEKKKRDYKKINGCVMQEKQTAYGMI